MQYDHLSSIDFWNLTYSAAKGRKGGKRKVWKELMSPEYADTVRSMADAHVTRIDKEVNYLLTTQGACKDDPDVVKMIKARDFIQLISNSAKRSMEQSIAEGKNIRKYAKIQDLMSYIEYLKDCIEDLRSEVPTDTLDFQLHTTFESWDTGEDAQESEIDPWLAARRERRNARQLF